LAARKSAGLKRVYYDWDDQLKTNESGNTQYTPINQTLWGLRASLDLLMAEGFENTIKRHHRYPPPPVFPLTPTIFSIGKNDWVAYRRHGE